MKAVNHITQSVHRPCLLSCNKGLYIYGYFLVLVLLAYAPLAMMHYSLKWDMVDCYLPWRYFAGESIRNGIFPLWNPYQHFGYPIHADLRSVFYPEVWIISLLGGYKVYTLNILFIFYLSLAGYGMFLLSSRFTGNRYAQVFAGTTYMLSGFFTGHGQEMFGIIAATWIPYVLYHYLGLLSERKAVYIIPTAFFLFLLLTGGYQALSIMLFYLLLILFMFFIGREAISARWQTVKRIMVQHVLLVLVVAASVIVLIVTFYQVRTHISRFGGTDIDEALFMPFSPQCLISFVFPFAVAGDTVFFDTDLSMSNAYVGLLTLALFLAGIFRRKTVMERVFLIFGSICLLAAFGGYTPVRQWLYDYVPLMNLFRMPAFFRYYAMVTLILLASSEAGRLFTESADRISLRNTLGLLLLIVIGFVGYTSYETLKDQGILSLFHGFITNLQAVVNQSTRHQRILFQGIIQLMALAFLLIAVWRNVGSPKLFARILLVITVAEMIPAIRLNFPVTVGSLPAPDALQAKIDQWPEAFPLPDLRIATGENVDNKPGMSPLWRNTNIFSKTVSAEGFNSFRIDAFERFVRDYPLLYNRALQRPVLFYAGTIFPLSALSDTMPKDLTAVFVENPVYEIPGDTKEFAVGETLQVLQFEPGHVTCLTNRKSTGLLTLQQACYPGWKVFVNGRPGDILITDQLFMSCLVPEGISEVRFVYTNTPVKVAYGVSMLVFMLTGAAMLHLLFRRTSPGMLAYRLPAIGGGIVLLALLSLLGISSTHKRRVNGYSTILKILHKQQIKTDSILFVSNVDDPVLLSEMCGIKAEMLYPHRLSRHRDYHLLDSVLNTKQDLRQAALVRYNLPMGPEAEEIMLEHFPNQVIRYQKNKVFVSVMNRVGERTPLFSTTNDFEFIPQQWTGDPSGLDTTRAWSGRFSYCISPEQPGSYAFVTRIGKLGIDKNLRIKASVMVMPTPGANAALYLMIDRRGNPIWQKAAGCVWMYPSAWQRLLLVGEPEIALNEDDTLKVFFWIEGSNLLYIDELRVEGYTSPKLE